MPRPVLHTRDAFLDAAVSLFADGGPRALTMSAVAQRSGAPSGSLYHQFPDRGALLAALWLRTVSRFHEGIHAVLDTGGPAAETTVACARHVVDWSAAHRTEAVVLLAGREAFSPELWTDAARHDLDAVDTRFAAAIRGLIRATSSQTGTARDIVRLALVELPYAAVRTHLARGEPVPRGLARTVVAAVRKLLH